MHIPNRYGQSRVDMCPFCQKQATTMNSQKVPVCAAHREERLDDLKCVCGSVLEMLHGKFGVFFSCIKCGNMNLRKVLEFNTVKPKMKNDNFSQSNEKTQAKKEINVRSDDSRYFD